MISASGMLPEFGRALANRSLWHMYAYIYIHICSASITCSPVLLPTAYAATDQMGLIMKFLFVFFVGLLNVDI